jgi:hypothetical protein
MGACAYTYMSSRVVPLLFGAFSVYLVARDRWVGRQERHSRVWARVVRWWPLALCFALAALATAPLVLYLANRPQDTATPQREGQVDRPLRELLQGNPRPVLQNAWALVKMWNLDGERYWQLNYSHRPVFVEPISGVLFWVGALVALWRWREPRFALLTLWVALGMLPSLLTSEAPSWPRTMLASPAALALPAIGAWGIGKAVQRCTERWGWRNGRTTGSWRPSSPVPNVLLLLLAISHLLTAVLTFRDYLVVWPRHPRVRYAFQSSMTEAMRTLDAVDEDTPVVMAGLSPHDMDPWTERSTLRRRDLDIRWVDTRSALVVPPELSSRLVTLDITPVDPALARWAGLGPGAIIARGDVVPRGGTEDQEDAPVYYDPAYTVFRLDGPALRERIGSAKNAAYVGSDPFAPTLLGTPPTFGWPSGEGQVRLAGYEWLAEPRAGTPAQLITYWQALDRGPRATVYGQPALRIYVHLLDREGAFVVGSDVLGAAPDTWRAGDTIVQLHAFTAPAIPGVYAVETGWYVPPDGLRLWVDARLPSGERVEAPNQRVLLAPIQVKP